MRPAAQRGASGGRASFGATCLLPVLLAAVSFPASAAPRYFSKITRHYDRLIEIGTDRYGPKQTALWLASIDIREGGQFEPAPETSRRTYRTIHAPHGSTLYWDQPAVAFAFWLSERTQEPRYAEAAEAYIRDFLDVQRDAESGWFLWGNHLYYDVFEDELVDIYEPWHEMRPLTPAWEMFARIDAEAAEAAARAAADGHQLDGRSGLFNRHAATRAGVESSAEPMPFLAAGGTLVETLAWLASRPGADDEALIDRARVVARYSHGARNLRTSLMPVQPVVDRWDKHAATTETGLWASSLFEAHRLSRAKEFRTRALDALQSHLLFGFSATDRRWHGMIDLETGSPVHERTTEWQPGVWSDVWEPLFPSHDYPMAFAEACLTALSLTEKAPYRRCVDDWVEHIEGSLPASFPDESITDEGRRRGAFAESYGRVIHFLVRASKELDRPELKERAVEIADDAVDILWVEEAGMFRSHPGDDRIDAVDGLGFLFAALAYLDTGDDPNLLGIRF